MRNKSESTWFRWKESSAFPKPGELTSHVQRFPQKSWLRCERDYKYTYDQVGNRLSSLAREPVLGDGWMCSSDRLHLPRLALAGEFACPQSALIRWGDRRLVI